VVRTLWLNQGSAVHCAGQAHHSGDGSEIDRNLHAIRNILDNGS
jgi:hypothetical protein